MLPPGINEGSMDQPKPSKSMVIAAAIDHVRKITLERDMMQNENDEIRQSEL
jgi:hypothetical protein